MVQERDSVAAGCLAPGDAHATGAQPAGQAPPCVGRADCESSSRDGGGGTPTGRAARGVAWQLSARSATSALSVPSRVRTAPTSATHRSSCSGSRPMTRTRTCMDQPHPALDPAYRAREPDRVAAQRIGRCAAARSPLGMRHHRFDVIEFARQPRGQTVRQQAEGGVALGAVPASDLRPARGLARVGAVACQRTFAVRVIRAAIEPCIAPRLGPNVSLAGEPRLVPKLQPAVARRGRPPRAGQLLFLVQRAVETTTRLRATPSGDDVDASCGPSAVLRSVGTRHGQVRGTCPPLAHTRRSRDHILTAATTIVHEKGNFTTTGCFPDCSVIPGNPSTE